MRKYVILFFIFFSSHIVGAQSLMSSGTISKEQVVSQMNYCINSITNVVHYKSMPLLEHEIDQLLNNLTMEQVVGLYEVQSFRSEMIEKISALQITEEEREMMKRVQEMKRENLLYQSIATSLNPTLLLTGGGNNSKQLAFMAIVTVARTAVEYKSASNEADIEELQAMWKYRKEDLKNFADLRKDALELVYNLFQKYGLNESDRLTEATSTQFSQIISEADAHARIRKLEDNRPTFEGMADYYYYLGMAYVDANDYQKGKLYLDKYLSLYQKAPIFRYDEKTGCIALTKLALDKNLSKANVINLVNAAIENLPNNGPAIIQSVLVLNDVGEKERAYNLLRSGIDNDLVSDKDALVMLATKLLPDMKQYPSSLLQITAAVKHCTGLSINSYIPFIVNSCPDKYWEELDNVIKMRGDEEFVVDSKYQADISSLVVQRERNRKELVRIFPCCLSYSNAISIKKIKRKFKSLKSNPEQIYIFFDPISGDNTYRVKPNIDYQKVIDGEYPGMTRPYIPAKERKRLAKFCKKKNEEFSGCINIIIENDNSCAKKVVRFAYADYLTVSESSSQIDYSTFNHEQVGSDVEYCKIKTRENVFRINPPLKNSPKELIRVILPGVDTIQLSFSPINDFKLYSVSVNDQECFRAPYIAEHKQDEIVKDEAQKASWFKRLLRKRMKWGEKASKAVLPDSLDEEIESFYSSNTVVGGIWHKMFKKDSTKVSKSAIEKEEPTELAQVTEDSDSSSKGWLRKLWDFICFWRK